MNEDFTDIKITGFDETVSTPVDGTSLFDLHFTLSDSTPTEWEAIFGQLWPNVFYSMRRDVRLEGSHLIITARPEEMEKLHMPQLYQTVDQTNREYRKFLQMEEAAAPEREAAVAENRKRIGGLGKRLGL